MSDFLLEMQNFFGGNADDDTLRMNDPKAVEKFYSKLALSYNMDELQGILDCDDNMLIIACAGAGKTTTLLLKIIRDVLSGRLTKRITINGNSIITVKKILVSTFLKTGAEDLAKKFDELCMKYKVEGLSSKNVAFRTIDSEVYNALKDMLGKDGFNLDEEKAVSFLKDACSLCQISSVQGNSKNRRLLTKEELNEISCLITYCRSRLDESKFNHPLMDEYNLTKIDIINLLDKYKKLKELNGVNDYQDLEEILEEGLRLYPNVVDNIKNRYDFVYVDEFQDISQLQYSIFRTYFKYAEGIIAIGDDDQCIYGWRGSDVSIITERFSEDFKPKIKHLTVNRRCPKTILNAVIPSIENNDNRHPKQLQASKEGGKIEIVVDGGMKYLSDSLKEDLAKSERVGILGRTNADLLVPALVLLLNNYTSFTVSKQVSLSNRVPTRVLGVMDLITQRYNENFEDYFKIFTNKGSNLQATKLANVLAIDPNLSIYNIPLDDVMYTVPDLCPLIRLLRAEKDKDPVGAYLKLLDYMERDVFTSKTIYAQRTRDFIYYIKHLIKEHDLLKDKSIDELQHLFKVEIAEKLEARIVKKQKRKLSNGSVEYYTPEDNSYVRITTIHDAKGKEWDNVYIWNDIDGCFPNSVGTRDLTDEEFEEERRIHYIAWTRAKKKLVVFTRSDANPGFLGECDLTSSEVITKNESLSTSKFNSKGQMHRKEEKVTSWENYFKSYVQKYTSYDKICTVQGTNLDICMTKLGGVNGVIEYLKGYGLEHYPLNELEGLITDLLEEKANSYS